MRPGLFEPVFRKSPFAAAILTIAALVGLTGCGSSFHPIEISDDTTGATTPDGRDYTTSSNDHVFQELRTSIDPNKGQNKVLATGVIDAQITRTVGAKSASLEVGLILSNALVMKFHVPMTQAGGELKAEDVVSANVGSHWKLSARCLDLACDSIVLRLKKEVDGELEAEAGLIYRLRNARIEVFGPFNPEAAASRLKDATTALQKTHSEEKTIPLETVEIAWGASRFAIKTDALCVRGPLVETGVVDQPISSGCDGASDSVNARLMGNNAKGDILIRLSEKESWAFMRISADRPPAKTGDGSEDDGKEEPLDPKALFLPIDLNHPATRVWQKDRKNPEIVSRIKEFEVQPKPSERRRRMTSFLKRVRPNLDILLGPIKEAQLPAETIFITFLESRFFTAENFPVEVSSVGAVGPWQFMPNTAKWKLIGLNIKPLVKSGNSMKADPCDERGDLRKSTIGAARYFKQLFKTFEKEPRLALMAYNWGPGNVSRAVKCAGQNECLKKELADEDLMHKLGEIQQAGFDYWTIRELRMAPKESLDYVANFIAAQFVGRDPSKFSIDLGTESYPVAPQLCPQ